MFVEIVFLLYHIVPGALPIFTLRTLRHARTVGGGSLVIEGCEGVRVNGARVIRGGIVCANGVFHAVEDVLPPALAAE